jgi:hypothetical protein
MFFNHRSATIARSGENMETLIGELLVAAKRLFGLRAGLCITAVAIYGYLLGSVLSRGAAAEDLAKLALLGALTIGAAAFAMRSAERHAQQQRRKRLDALYGRDSDR